MERSPPASETARERGALLGVLAVAAAVRLFDLGADVAPRYVSSAAPLEDAFWYLEAAAGAVEGGQPEPTAWDVPVWTQLARVWLRLWGSSWATAHALGAAISWVTVLLTWRWVRATCGPRPALVAAGALAVLPPFVVLGRTPLLYGPLTLFLVTLAALTRIRTRGGLPVAYAGVLGAVVVARPPAGVLLGGLVALEWSRSRSRRVTVYRWLGLAAVGLAVLFDRKPDLLAETRYRLQLQVGQLDPLDLLWRLLRLFGDVALERSREVEVGGVPWVTSGSGYGALAGGVLLAAGCGALFALRHWSVSSRARRELVIVSLGWLATFALGVSLMSARPLRYFPLIAPPLATLIGLGLAAAQAPSPAAPMPHGARWAAGLVAAWVFSHVGDAALTALRDGVPPTRRAGLPVLAVLAGAGLALPWLWRPRPRSPRARRLAPALLTTLALVPSALGLLSALAYGGGLARAANMATAEIVGPEALVVGPHASYLMLGSQRRRLRAPWLRTRPPYVESTLDGLIQRGATHVALGEGQAASAELVPQFDRYGASLTLVAVFETPYGRTRLYRFPWAEALGYVLTPAEAEGPISPSGEIPWGSR